MNRISRIEVNDGTIVSGPKDGNGRTTRYRIKTQDYICIAMNEYDDVLAILVIPESKAEFDSERRLVDVDETALYAIQGLARLHNERLLAKLRE